MQPGLMSYVMLPFKKITKQATPSTNQRGIKAFNRQLLLVNSLKNIPSCLYKRLVRNLQTS